MVRAPHIAQAFLFHHKLPPLTTRLRSIEQHTIANNLINAQGLLFMEYAKQGDMRNMLNKLANAGRHLPPEALWRIFDCLVKGCIAMEYPPRLVPPGYAVTRNERPLPEVIPPGGQAGPVRGYRGVVHFDLDPKNSMPRRLSFLQIHLPFPL